MSTPRAHRRSGCVGLDAIRRGAGDEVVLLGCGCPLGPAVGVVDAMRVGPDVAPFWEPRSSDVLPGFEGAPRSLRNAWAGSAARWFQHGRLWRNDPDCILLRGTKTELAPGRRIAWAEQVGAWGGSVLVSDDLALLGPTERSLLARILADR
jgi:alpha-galactosidase